MSNQQNKPDGSRRGRAGRIAAAALFVLAGVLLAMAGKNLAPSRAGAGGAVETGQAAGDAAGAGAGTSADANVGTASEAAQQAASGDSPVIWYTDTALKIYFPKTKETVQVAELKDGGMDRMSHIYYANGANTSDYVRISADQTRVWYQKNITTDLMSGTTGDLYTVSIDGDKAGEEQLLAGQIRHFDLMPDGRVYWVDSNGSMYLSDGTGDGEQTEKVLSGVMDVWLSEDGQSAFLLTDTGSGWYLNTADGSRKKIAAGISSVAYASPDLTDLYYYGGLDWGTGSQNLYYVSSFGTPQIVDVDVVQAAFLKKTGHVYYLKEDPTAGTAGDPAGTDASAAPTGEAAETVPEESGTGADATGGQETGTGADETDGQETGTGENGAQENITREDLERLIDGLVDRGVIQDSGTDETTSETEEAAEIGTDTADRLTQDLIESEHLYTLCWFDGTQSTEVMRGVETLDVSRADLMQKDRAVFWCGLSGKYKIYLAVDGTALDTGFHMTDEGLLDLCPDFQEDSLYYVRQEGDAAGTLQPGTVYRKSFTTEGFGEEEKVFDEATSLNVVNGGTVFAGIYEETEDTPRLSVNGETIADHVQKFVWDENGLSPKVQIYRNVFSSSYYSSGELDEWSGISGTALTPIAYNVREYHVQEDGSFTILSDYDEEEDKGTLYYWDGLNAPVKLDSEAQGTRKGEDELAGNSAAYLPVGFRQTGMQAGILGRK